MTALRPSGSHDTFKEWCPPTLPLPSSQWLPSPPASPSSTRKFAGSSLPFEPITLVFQDLHYSVPNPAFRPNSLWQGTPTDFEAGVPERLELLRNVTGECGSRSVGPGLFQS